MKRRGNTDTALTQEGATRPIKFPAKLDGRVRRGEYIAYSSLYCSELNMNLGPSGFQVPEMGMKLLVEMLRHCRDSSLHRCPIYWGNKLQHVTLQIKTGMDSDKLASGVLSPHVTYTHPCGALFLISWYDGPYVMQFTHTLSCEKLYRFPFNLCDKLSIYI